MDYLGAQMQKAEGYQINNYQSQNTYSPSNNTYQKQKYDF